MTQYIDIVKEVVAATFNCDMATLCEDTGPGAVPRWDSLGHIILLEALSSRFGMDIPIERAIEAKDIRALAMLFQEPV